jgi:hypothetical protein
VGRLTDLPVKQLAFARYVADGSSYSDAYRKAFDTQASGRSVNSKASALMAKPDVRGRVEQLIRAKEQAITRSSLSEREQVLSKLRTFADTATSEDSAKIRATELWGKAIGLFKPNRDDDLKENMSAAEIESKLKALLADALGTDIDAQYTVQSTDRDDVSTVTVSDTDDPDDTTMLEWDQADEHAA